MKKCICIVSYDWRNIFETDFAQMKDKLKRDRILSDDVEIFIIDWSTKTYFDKRENVSTQHIKGYFGRSRYVYDFLSIFVVPYYLRKHQIRPDYFYTLNFPIVFSAWFAKLVYKTKVLLYLSARPREIAYTRKQPLFRNVYHRISEFFAKPLVDYYFANGYGTLDYLVEIGVPQESVNLVYKDVISRDMTFIRRAKKGKVRKKFGIDHDKKLILSVGRLVEEKNYKALIDNISQVQEGVLMIVGSGEMKEELEQYVQDRGLSQKVVFTGQVSREEIWEYYLDADVFVLSSRSEGNPNVVREAMYMSTPVIANAIPAITEFQKSVNHEIMKVIDINDQNAFVSAINEVFGRKDQTKMMIVYAHQEIDKQLKESEILFNLVV